MNHFFIKFSISDKKMEDVNISVEDLIKIAKNAFPPTEGSEVLEAAREEIEILWDKWGIPHIYAKSINDAYIAQGYLHARHRLFQLEQFRRMTIGKLSEIVGEEFLNSDKHYKTIGMHRISRKCAKRLRKDPNNEQLRMLESYVKGVNAGIEKAQKNPPVEFAVLNLKIQDWSIEDSLRISCLLDWGLSGNYSLELLREEVVLKIGLELADKIIPLYSGAKLERPGGSNAWAVSRDKSATGAVLFANDPHLPLMLPAIWFLVHIHCPECNSIGSSIPGLPSVVLGHNEKIAWGCTNVGADTIDLFRLEINPENNNQYRFDGQWLDFEIIEDPITVRNKTEPIPFKVLMTKYGPVLEFVEHSMKLKKLTLPGKFAFRWVSHEGNLESSLEGFLKINKASNWTEFREGTSLIALNPQNFVYGDIEGNIGLQHGGKIPIRKYGDGAMITPGTGEKFNWEGLAPFEKLLSIYNPSGNFVYTANYNENKAPNGVLISQDSNGFYRQKRLKNLLQSKDKISQQDFMDFQNDLYTEEARDYLPLMLKYVNTSDINPEILRYLENWDFQLTKTSIGGTIYKIWLYETIKKILIPLIGKDLVEPYLASSPFDLKRLVKLYDNKNAELRNLLNETLKITINFLSKKLSPDFTKWKWGNLHKTTLIHPFSSVSEEAKVLNIGPFKTGGDPNTLCNGYYIPENDFQVFAGPSYRQIHDLTDWDKSLVALPGGQSGLPFHKHYNDLMKLWVRGKYVPFLFTREAISKNLEGIFKILPK